MRKIQNRKIFEEGDNVIVKGTDRKGTVNKRKGDFYNVTLDAAEEQEKDNVYSGDMVKASKSINSMAIKQIEKYYKQGILNKREVIAVLIKENGWSFPEAKQIADYYEKVFTPVHSSRRIKSSLTKEQYYDMVKRHISTNTSTPEFRAEELQAVKDFPIGTKIAFREDNSWHDVNDVYTKTGEDSWNYQMFINSKEEDSFTLDDNRVAIQIHEEFCRHATPTSYVGGYGSIRNSKSLVSRFNQNVEHLYTLSEAAQYLSALFFDLRTIHFLTTGSEFYTYHELAQELYEKTEDYYDDMVETAIGYDSDVSPMYVLPGDWQFVDEYGSFDTNGQVTQTLILDRLERIYDILESVNQYDSMVQSKIDSMLEYYDKEIYKLKQAMK